MEQLILAKIFTIHNIIYFVLSTLIAGAIVNKMKISNLNMIWTIPLVWIGIWIALRVLGAFLHFLLIPLIIIGLVVVAVMYLKKKVT